MASWREIGDALLALPARFVPSTIRQLERALSTWPDELRVAASSDTPDAGGNWWELGLQSGARGRAAVLVRRASAGTSEVTRLSPLCGWARDIHERCDWRVLRVESDADLTTALSLIGKLRGVDMSLAYPKVTASAAFAHSLEAGTLDNLVRLVLSGQKLREARRLFVELQAPSLEHVQRLELGSMELRHFLGSVVRRLSLPARVRELDVSNNEASFEDVRFLADRGYLCELTRLDLGRNAISGSDVAELFRLERPSRLTSLMLDGLRGVLDMMAVVPDHLPALRRLTLRGTGLDVNDFRALLASPTLSQLEVLDLRGNDFFEEELRTVLDQPPPLNASAVLLDDELMSEELRALLQKWRAHGAN